MCIWLLSCSLLALLFVQVSGEKSYHLQVQDRAGELACLNTPSGQLVPHPSNCNAYFRCADHSVDYGECDSAQFFNPDTQLCDDWKSIPSSSPCFQAVQPSFDHSLILASRTEAYEPACNASSFPYKVPHPYDCQLYFVCLSGRYQEYKCPAEQYFNPDPKVDDCQASLPTDSPCLANTPPPETTTPMATPGPDACEGQSNGTCIDVDGYCDIYYICVGGAATAPVKCPNGFYSDPDTCTCKFPEDATSSNCYVTPPPTTTTVPNYPICIGRQDGERIPDPNACAGYFVCNREVATRYTCPPPLYFSSVNNDCTAGTPPDPCRPLLPAEACKTAPDGTYLRDPNSCVSYYICAGNVAYKYDCPPARQQLFFEEKVRGCISRVALLTGTTCSIPLNNRCTNVPPDNHKFGDGADCTNYFICTDGIPARPPTRCPYHFDPIIQDCSTSVAPPWRCT